MRGNCLRLLATRGHTGALYWVACEHLWSKYNYHLFTHYSFTMGTMHTPENVKSRGGSGLQPSVAGLGAAKAKFWGSFGAVEVNFGAGHPGKTGLRSAHVIFQILKIAWRKSISPGCPTIIFRNTLTFEIVQPIAATSNSITVIYVNGSYWELTSHVSVLSHACGWNQLNTHRDRGKNTEKQANCSGNRFAPFMADRRSTTRASWEQNNMSIYQTKLYIACPQKQNHFKKQ